MALLSELVKIVAEVEGLDEVSVGIFARSAREAGHIKQGGRGRSAAKMDTQDAANLLIAANACALAKEVAEAVLVYRSMRTAETEDTGKVKRLLGDLQIFRPGGTFGEDLEDVISLCGDPERRAILTDFPAGAVVRFERPIPTATIRINIKDGQGTTLPVNRSYWPVNRASPGETGDRTERTEISISVRTLAAVAEALRT